MRKKIRLWNGMRPDNNVHSIFLGNKLREMLNDNLKLKLDIEMLKRKIENHDKNIQLVFSFLDRLIEEQEKPEPRKRIGYKQSENN